MAEATTTKGTGDTLGTGRRKSAVARVRIRPGTGMILINRRPLDEYFPLPQHRNAVLAPLVHTDKVQAIDVSIRVHGGGPTGQADACKLGVARALKLWDPALLEPLRDADLLTRDDREVERKKYGLRGARRATQFSKR
ncbi:MAG TPA: 30S ribosomal protein S9 [Thermoguttaceae bacterium]|nr:30S ribosomal protein S9 [Thermoguttaceae bacterium]